LTAEGSENTPVQAHRVWVLLRQIADGQRAGFGEVLTLADATAYGLNADGPDTRIDRLRRAALSPSRACARRKGGGSYPQARGSLWAGIQWELSTSRVTVCMPSAIDQRLAEQLAGALKGLWDGR
jgi:hypothetical protein